MPAAWLLGLGLQQPSPKHAGYVAAPGGSPTHRRRGLSRFRLFVAISGALVLAFLANNYAALMPMDRALYEWSLKGCPTKILDLTTTMQASYQVGAAAADAGGCASPYYACPVWPPGVLSIWFASQGPVPAARQAALAGWLTAAA